MSNDRKSYMADRIVYCANCDANTRLYTSPGGLVCQSCASTNWMHLPQIVTPGLMGRTSATANVSRVGAMSKVILQAVHELSNPGLTPITSS